MTRSLPTADPGCAGTHGYASVRLHYTMVYITAQGFSAIFIVEFM